MVTVKAGIHAPADVKTDPPTASPAKPLSESRSVANNSKDEAQPAKPSTKSGK